MKRIHLFEFEDFKWFPSWLRDCMTNYIVSFHSILGTHSQIANLVSRCLLHTKHKRIIDLCSGGGGPMPKVKELLDFDNQTPLVLTDLYPNEKFSKKINHSGGDIKYLEKSIDATNVPADLLGVRTMICSFHHMNVDTATSILKNAQNSGQPICIYEISDNSSPKAIWWIAIPITFIMTFFITPFVRPFTWKQFIFTYVIPLLPFFIAWDGAVSNARTYTLNDMDVLLNSIKKNEGYQWEKGSLKGKGGNKLYLLGLPKLSTQNS